MRKKKKKRQYNVVPRQVLRRWGRISVHVRDKSLLQGIFRASLKQIELSDLGEEEEEEEPEIWREIQDFELRASGVRRER